MIAFPNAKINLGLYVTKKRPDGYHDIETLFYPVPLCDVLEIVPSDDFGFQSTGLHIPEDGKDNLVLQAYELLAENYGLPPVQIHLHKVIPMGAGLGGGSSDAAFALRLLNNLFHLNLSQSALSEVAVSIGSDCPFFLSDAPKIGTGRGTDLQDYNLSLAGKYLILYTPNVHVSTREAYSNINPKTPAVGLIETLQSPATWQSHLINDFEKQVFLTHPELAQLKQSLYDQGAFYAAMSGSGSAVFGLLEEEPDAMDGARVMKLS